MEEIYDTTDAFPFSELKLNNPTSVNGGHYHLKMSIKSHPLYIQTPKCKTKGGFVKSGKKMQCELMFTNEDEEFIRWMESLETHCYNAIYARRSDWFTTDMEMTDIENYFISPLKLYKSGKYYLLKVNVSVTLGKTNLKIYDENETSLEMEQIQENTKVISILEIQSVKCSARSFQIEMELKQMMVLNPTDIFEKCIIKTALSSSTTSLPSSTASLLLPPMRESFVTESSPADVKPLESLEKEILENTENTEKESIPPLSKSSPDDLDILEVDLDLEQIPETESFQIKKRDDVYYKIYLEAKQKAKVAKDLALAAYLEVKRIKNSYLLEDSEEEEEDSLDFKE
jgi:hypothetical protein